MSRSFLPTSSVPRPQPPRRGWPLLLVAGSLALGALLGANRFQLSRVNPEATSRGYLKFREVLSHIDEEYVDSVDAEGLSDYAIQQLLERLDPHSTLVPARDRAQAAALLQSDYDGIGVEFNQFRDTIVVIAPLSGGPAEQAGLQPGDRLLAVNQERVAGRSFSLAQLFSRLRGPAGSSVQLLVRRPGSGRPLLLNVTRNRIPNASLDVAYMLDEHTGYIKISRFAAGTYDEFKQALGDLRRQGLEQLILDLRGNPGGYLDRATRLADEFVSGTRKLVYTDGKGDQYDSQTYSRVTGEFEEGPLVVLIDEGSASAAEVVAGALQDHDRALLVGRRSFGKGLVQQPIALNDGSELRLTIARYYTPAGRCIQKSYAEGTAAYRQELAGRAQHGELLSADSVHLADSVRFRTTHGRLVYGGGGIIPDVFVARDSSTLVPYYTRLHSLNLVREQALQLYQTHRPELEAMRFEQFQQTFQISDNDLQALVSRAQAVGVAPDATGLRRCRALLRNQLKAYVARSAYGKTPYYLVLHEQDAELRQALETVRDGRAAQMPGLTLQR